MHFTIERIIRIFILRVVHTNNAYIMFLILEEKNVLLLKW